MRDKIQIVNFLLTRRCNLHCSYCRISRDYQRPDEYPSFDHYINNEISTTNVILFLSKLKNHNPEVFVIFYGGEPLLRKDLPEIINYCNESQINYTIITNNSDEVQPKIETLFKETNFIAGLTSSVDPILFMPNQKGDIYKKSKSGFERLIEYKDEVDDVVAEITATNETKGYLYRLIEELTAAGISSSITFIDIAKSIFYDFSNVTDENILVQPTDQLADILDSIYSSKHLNVHMREQIPLFMKMLPSDLDCKIEENISNITVDSDGSIRLCLRIRSIVTPTLYNINNIFLDDYNLNPNLKKCIGEDKKSLCKKCNWTCMLMSSLTSKNENLVSELLHSNLRENSNPK
jgi:MoaA/NifB/PqqE/SkfB family radical SAM enzyme